MLDAIREYANFTGTKKGRDHGQCGTCLVHCDGERIVSCLKLAVMKEGTEITTGEAVGQKAIRIYCEKHL